LGGRTDRCAVGAADERFRRRAESRRPGRRLVAAAYGIATEPLAAERLRSPSKRTGYRRRAPLNDSAWIGSRLFVIV
jgi:hypothetical protein